MARSFTSITTALKAARHFRKHFGSHGNTYRADASMCPQLFGQQPGQPYGSRRFYVAVYSSRGTFLTLI